MKNFILLLMLLASNLFVPAISQDFNGSWQGSILAGGTNLKLIFNITQTNGVYVATMDSPDQNTFGIKFNTTIIKEDSVVIGLTRINGGFKGKRETANLLKGIFSQGPINIPLTLTRLDKSSPQENPATKIKPQTPSGPFNYAIEEVSYTNQQQHITLGGTLTKPKGAGNFPAVLLITGSGAQDRDETIGMHKPFWVIADYLTNQGIAVLRVDDRGVGKSTGEFKKATSADFATDVASGIDYLKSRPDIDTSKLGLLGHSEGGMIAPYVAARRKEVAFMVLLAGLRFAIDRGLPWKATHRLRQ